MTANIMVKKPQDEVPPERGERNVMATGLHPETVPRRERLKQVVRETLGDHSKRVVGMLSTVRSDAPEALQAICDEAVRFTSFFISKDTAEELGRRMRAVIDEWR